MKPRSLFGIFILSVGLVGFSYEKSTYRMEYGESTERDQLAALYSLNRQKMADVLSQKHIGLELLVADSYGEKAESRFGHALIRFIDEDQDPFNDLVVGFEMQALREEDKYTKGFSGGAETVPMVYSLVDIIRKYVIHEKRPLTRIILPSSTEQIQRLKNNFNQFLILPRIVGDYNFIRNNCATALLKVLFDSGYYIDHAWADVPTLFSKRFRFNLMTPYPAIIIPSAGTLVESLSRISADHCAIRTKSLDVLLKTNCFWSEIEALPFEQLELLFFTWPAELMKTKGRLAEVYLSKVKSKIGLSHVLNLKPISPLLYKICVTGQADCRRDRLAEVLKLWTADQMRSATQDFILTYKNELQRGAQLIQWKRIETYQRLSSPLVQDNVRFPIDLRK